MATGGAHRAAAIASTSVGSTNVATLPAISPAVSPVISPAISRWGGMSEQISGGAVHERFEHRQTEPLVERALHDRATRREQFGLLRLGHVVVRRADEAQVRQGRVGAARDRVRLSNAVAVLARSVVAERHERTVPRRRGGTGRRRWGDMWHEPQRPFGAEESGGGRERETRRRDHERGRTQRARGRKPPPPRRTFAGFGVQPRQVVNRRDRRARCAQRDGGDGAVQDSGAEIAHQSRDLKLAAPGAVRRGDGSHLRQLAPVRVFWHEHDHVVAEALRVLRQPREERARHTRHRAVREADRIERDLHGASSR